MFRIYSRSRLSVCLMASDAAASLKKEKKNLSECNFHLLRASSLKSALNHHVSRVSFRNNCSHFPQDKPRVTVGPHMCNCRTPHFIYSNQNLFNLSVLSVICVCLLKHKEKELLCNLCELALKVII